MLSISNRASDDFLATFNFNYLGTKNNAGSGENLTVYGNKPNAIVRPLQHNEKEPTDGLILTDLESQIVQTTTETKSNETNEKRSGSENELNKEDFFSRQLDQKLRLYNFSKGSSRNVCTFIFNFHIKKIMEFEKNREVHVMNYIRNRYSLPQYLEVYFFNQPKHFHHFRK